jgi:hypothetical protein
MWSEAEIDHILHEFYIDFKPIYLGGELKVYSFLKGRYSNPINSQATMLGFLEKDQQLLQPWETKAVKLEIFVLENLKFTNF